MLASSHQLRSSRPSATVEAHLSSRTKSALHSVANTVAQVGQLALGFLCLAGLVLLDAIALQLLVANEVANGLLCGADGLVPRASGAVRVVLCDTTAARDGGAADFTDAVREVGFGLGLGLLGFTGLLGGVLASRAGRCISTRKRGLGF